MHINTQLILRFFLLVLLGSCSLGAMLLLSPPFFTLPTPRPGCDEPIPYRIDDIDARFPLDKKAFRRAVFEAEQLWEKGVGRDLLRYDQGAPFPIRTEFDDRQKMTYEAQHLEDRVSEYETEAKRLETRYDSLAAKYEKESDDLKKRVAAYEKRLDKYNDEVEKWNRLGGAPEDEYDSLKKEQKKLENLSQELTGTSSSMNALASEINQLAEKLNRKSNEVNRNIDTFRERYGEPKPFIQGLYDGGEPSITIFQFEDENDLRLVLAHEFGHALGIGEHVEGNESALMYALMGGQDLEYPELAQEDIDSFSASCPERIYTKSEKITRYLVLTPWNEFRISELLSLANGG